MNLSIKVVQPPFFGMTSYQWSPFRNWEGVILIIKPIQLYVFKIGSLRKQEQINQVRLIYKRFIY